MHEVATNIGLFPMPFVGIQPLAECSLVWPHPLWGLHKCLY